MQDALARAPLTHLEGDRLALLLDACTFDRRADVGGMTDWTKRLRVGNYWGPPATRARMSGQLPPLAMMPAMTRWSAWGRKTLPEGDIVFRLGNARIMRGSFPLSLFIARASGSPFSHTGIVAIEGGSPVVYDSALTGSSDRRSRSGCSVRRRDRCQAIEGRAAAPHSRRHRILS